MDESEKKIEVLYDYQVLRFQQYGGISRYFYEIYTSFRTKYIDKMWVNISVLFSCNHYFIPYVRRYEKSPKYVCKLLNYCKIIFHICGHYLSGHPYDVIHPTYYFPGYLSFIPAFIRRKSKLVITVYDMIYEMFYPQEKSIAKKRKDIILGADGIIAISQKTKEDIMSIYPDIPDQKIRVIYLGNSMKEPMCKNKIQFPKRYILMVGNRDFYKNGTIVFRALKRIRNIFGDIQLLCVGGGSFNDDEINILNELKLEKAVIHMSLDGDGIYYAYRYASCLIFPSLYEGFGLPILEAFYCECPVILSNASCFPEIAQDGALYFEPDNVDELVEKIQLVVGNREISDKLIEKGKQRLQFFSWDKTAAETYEFYKEVIDEKI